MLLVGASRPSVASEIGQLTNEGPARTRLEGLIRFGAARAFTLMAGFQLVRALACAKRKHSAAFCSHSLAVGIIAPPHLATSNICGSIEF